MSEFERVHASWTPWCYTGDAQLMLLPSVRLCCRCLCTLRNALSFLCRADRDELTAAKDSKPLQRDILDIKADE